MRERVWYLMPIVNSPVSAYCAIYTACYEEVSRRRYGWTAADVNRLALTAYLVAAGPGLAARILPAD